MFPFKSRPFLKGFCCLGVKRVVSLDERKNIFNKEWKSMSVKVQWALMTLFVIVL